MKTILTFFFITYGYFATAKVPINKVELDIKNGKNYFQHESSFWDKYSGGIIAGITVLASLGISVWQARASQRYTKALSISEARMQWIQELRPIMSKLISDISIFNFELNKRIESNPKKDLEVNEPIYKIIAELNLALNQVKLYLNHDEKKHSDFIKFVDQYINNSIKIAEGSRSQPNDVNEENLINCAKLILKDAWEQAKK